MDISKLLNADLSQFSEDDLAAALFFLRLAVTHGKALEDATKYESYAAYGRIAIEIEERNE